MKRQLGLHSSKFFFKLDHGADWRKKNGLGVPPLSVALVRGRSEDAFHLLWERMTEVEAIALAKSREGGELLLDAAR